MLADTLIIIGSFLLSIVIVVKGISWLLHRLYFSPDSPRRRMPQWLIVCILVSFLVLPKVDINYLANRDKKQPAQVA